MNTPNPLIPQGSLERQSKGKSTVRIAILTIVSIHAVFFAGLLMQGCRRDEGKGTSKAAPEATNQVAATAPEGTSAYYAPSNQEVAQASNTIPSAQSVTTPPVITEPVATTPPPVVTEPPVDGKAYKVAKGDTLAKIAKANGVSVTAIGKANPTLEASKLKVGQTIQIPPAAAASAGLGFSEPGKADASASSDGGKVHRVKAGETLTKIAKQYNTSPKAIRAANNLKTDRLVVGQRIKLPAAAAATAGGTDTGKAPTVSKMSATNPAYVTPMPSSLGNH